MQTENKTSLHFDEPVTRTQELMNLCDGDVDAVIDQLHIEYDIETDKKKRFMLKCEYNALAAQINRDRRKHIYNSLK